MADNLDPTPGDQPKSITDVLAQSTSGKSSEIPTHVKKDIAKRKAKEPPSDKFTKDKDELVTIKEYHALMADRPIKFGPKTTGFVRDGGKTNGHPCLKCVHWFMGHASDNMTCEIVRVSDTDDKIHDDDTCKLWSEDGQTLPLLESEENTAA